MKIAATIAAGLLVGAFAASKALVANFDKMPALAPPLLGNLVNPVVPNPYGSLLYDNSWAVVLLGSQLLPMLKAASIYNVIASPPLNLTAPGPSISKANGIKSVTIDSLYFACATQFAAQTVPVSCVVLFSGLTTAGGNKSKRAQYTSGGAMLRLQLGFTDLSSLSVMVLSVSTDQLLLSPVSVLIDSISYTTYT